MSISVEDVIDAYVDANPEHYAVVLAQLLAYPEQGGRGYGIFVENPFWELDGWHVDRRKRKIILDRKGFFGSHSRAEVAEQLTHAVETEFLKTREGLLSRVGWGTGKVVLGAVETAIGVIGILVPEPGTTAGGVVVTTLGVNTVVDGVSQLAGANHGNGINLLATGAGNAGAALAELAGEDPATGRRVGETTFLVSSIAAGAWGSIRVLKVPGQVAVSTAVKGRPGGLVVGRLDMLYQSGRAGDGMTIININNNARQSILRFVTHEGKLMVNGRIVGVPNGRLLRHATDGKEILKGILKLLAHGSKF